MIVRSIEIHLYLFHLHLPSLKIEGKYRNCCYNKALKDHFCLPFNGTEVTRFKKFSAISLLKEKQRGVSFKLKVGF